MILEIETSCDETAAALITAEGDVLASVVASQVELHSPFGGVVPEVAARHLELVSPVVEAALHDADATVKDVDLVAATQGPGLVGALLVGLSAAKALAWGLSIPLAPVDHLHGHVASLFLGRDPTEPPFVCLLATGGHTMVLEVTAHDRYNVLGQTLDDAAGEAFDKGARLLGLGYPGGPELERAARDGEPAAYSFPVAKVAGLDFSFSGVKTALLYAVKELGADELERRRADLAASYQRAIVDALVQRARQAARQTGVPASRSSAAWPRTPSCGMRCRKPSQLLSVSCTDNAAMIASAARWVEPLQPPDYLDLEYASVAQPPAAAFVLGCVAGALTLVAYAAEREESGKVVVTKPAASDWRVSSGRLVRGRARTEGHRPAQGSVTGRPRAGGRRRGNAAAERRWTAAALASQQQFLTELAAQGIVARLDLQFTRVLNGFSAVADPSAVVLLERSPQVAGVSPWGCFRPQPQRPRTPPGLSRRPGSPRFEERVSRWRCSTPLSTRPRRSFTAALPGFDVIGGGAAAWHDQKPGGERLEAHGTAMAGIVAGPWPPGGALGHRP